MGFKLSAKKDFYLSILLERLKRLDVQHAVSLLETARIEIVESCEQNDWNGGQDGHAVYCYVPSDIFLDNLDSKEVLEGFICTEFNKIYSFPNEFVCNVEILPDDNHPISAQKTMHYYVNNKLPSILQSDLKRIWENTTEGYGAENCLCVFISHRDLHKKQAHLLQEELKKYGILSFVAHKDIKATEEWTKEILRALMSMDIFLCFITDDFFASKWTNQEVGFALGKDIPIIPLKVEGANPEGFISVLQAGTYSKNDCAKNLIALILKTDSISIFIKNKIIRSVAMALRKANDWIRVEKIAKSFDYIETLNEEQAQWFIDAFNQNSQIQTCTALSGYNCYFHQMKGSYFVQWINKCTGRKFFIEKNNRDLSLVEKDTNLLDDTLPF